MGRGADINDGVLGAAAVGVDLAVMALPAFAEGLAGALPSVCVSPIHMPSDI